MTVMSAAQTLGEESGWRLTPLEYQKTLYIAQMLHLGATGSQLFREEFEAWDLGPVVPYLYRSFRHLGRTPVPAGTWGKPFEWGTAEAFSISDAFVLTRHLTPSQLVNLTHREGGAWSEFYQPGGANSTIPAAAIVREWQEFMAPSQEALYWAHGMADRFEESPARLLDDQNERAFRARLFGAN